MTFASFRWPSGVAGDGSVGPSSAWVAGRLLGSKRVPSVADRGRFTAGRGLHAPSERIAMMRRFVQAAVVAAAISAPVFAGALMDHSVVSVLGQPTGGKCSSNCSVGGLGSGASSGAPGGHMKMSAPGVGSASISGTASTGRIVSTVPGIAGSASGNFTNGIGAGKGHCTGFLTPLCSTGP
jgi:hypothetical protein